MAEHDIGDEPRLAKVHRDARDFLSVQHRRLGFP
jgi:hypothetical protein